MDKILIKTMDNTTFLTHNNTVFELPKGFIIDTKKYKWGQTDNKLIRDILDALIRSDNVKQMSAFSCDKNNSLVQEKPFFINGEPNTDLFNIDNGKNVGVWGFAGVIRNEIDWNGKKYDVTLEVRSRFDEENKPWFLATMLSQFITGEQRISTSNEVWKGDIEIFGFLSAVLFQNLLKRAYESGIYKTYVRIEHNDEKLRGTIDIARHLRLNAGRNDAVIAYNTREHSYDNMLNHLIIITWDYLKRRYSGICEQIEKDTEFLRAVKNIRGFIGGKRAEKVYAVQEIARRLMMKSDRKRDTISNPDCAADAAYKATGYYETRERFKVIVLNTKNHVLGIEEISVGTLSASLVHPREVFQAVLKYPASAFTIFHNHPSGDPSPSREDIAVTERLVKSGKVLGIDLLDHIILGKENFLSMKEEGMVQ